MGTVVPVAVVPVVVTVIPIAVVPVKRYFSFDDSIGNGMLKKRVRKKLGFPILP